jgi:hypothetical protein
MTSLRELQARFQAGILSNDDAILNDVKDSDREDRTTLFGVYRHAYVARLAEILGREYERLHAYLGDTSFAQLAKAYISSHPSDQRNARWYGRHLPQFARETEPFANHPEVAELAALEKALADTFDGPDADLLTLTDLQTVPTENWPSLTFTPHPAVVRLSQTTNADALWSALKDETAPPKPVSLPEPRTMLFWRKDGMARFRPLEAEEAMMWNEAAKGVRFGMLCEIVATFGGAEGSEMRAATYLTRWVDSSLLAGYGIERQSVVAGAGNSALVRPLSQ